MPSARSPLYGGNSRAEVFRGTIGGLPVSAEQRLRNRLLGRKATASDTLSESDSTPPNETAKRLLEIFEMFSQHTESFLGMPPAVIIRLVRRMLPLDDEEGLQRALKMLANMIAHVIDPDQPEPYTFEIEASPEPDF